MKISLLVFSLMWLSCSESSSIRSNSANNSVDTLVQKAKIADSITTNLTVPKQELKSTLDSLQGIWLSVINKQESLVINDTQVSFKYGKTGEKEKFFLADDCKYKTELMNKTFGSHILTLNPYDDTDVSCYEIEMLTSEKLALVYGAKTLSYSRVKK